MRFDKLTTKFQQALADAQKPGPRHDAGFIEPQQPARRAARAGGRQHDVAARPRGRPGAPAAVRAQEGDRRPAEGRGDRRRDQRLSRLERVLNLTDKEAQKRGDQFIAASSSCWRLPTTRARPGRLLKEYGLTRKAARSAIEAVRGGARRRFAGSRRSARGAQKYTIDLTERAKQGKSTR